MKELLRFAPNIAGASYATGNIVLFATGGIGGNAWQMAAGLLWALDAVILAALGQKARGIELHALTNIAGSLCMLMAARTLEHPLSQVLFCAILIACALVKYFAPAADTPVPRPQSVWQWPNYAIRRHPMQLAAIMALIGRPFIIVGAILNAQWGLLISALLWVMGDVFQFLSRKGMR